MKPVVSLVVLMFVLSSPAQAAPGASTFKGVTTTARAADEGLATFNADCAALYPRSRICTDVDVFETLPAPTPGADAWIMQTVVAYDSSRGYTNPYGMRLDEVNTGPNCGYCISEIAPYSHAGSYQSVIFLTSAGEFDYTTCGDTLVVACCGR